MSEPVAPNLRFRLRLCGGLRVERNGERLAPHEVGSRKGRALLHLLAVERGRHVSTDRLVEALWPENPPRRPADNVASLVSRLRGLLGSDAIEGGRGGYRLVTGTRVVVDLDEASALAVEAETCLAAGEPTLAFAAGQRAVELLGNSPTATDTAPYTFGVADADAEAARLLRRARGVTWEAALALGRHQPAAELAGAAVAADPFDEEATRALMRARYRAGEPAAAVAAYEHLRARLAEDLGVDPSQETSAVHVAILREQAPPESSPRRIAPSSRSGDAPSGQPELVGREQELSWLEAAWAGVLAKGASLVLVAGEAGIGKTRLATEAAHRAGATGGAVLRSRCYRAERSLFLQPVLEAVREVAVTCPPDVLADLAGEWAAAIGDLVPELAEILRPLRREPSMPELERRRAFEGVTAFFRRLAQRQPVFLLLDDLQHAGDATIELLHYMVRRLSAPLLVVATLRTDEGAEWRERLQDTARVLDVGPLAPAAVATLAAQMGAAHLAEGLRKRTGGHPLFLVEALRAAAEGGRGVDGVPDTLRTVVLGRVRALGSEVEDLLRAAVVFGTAFDVATVAELVGIGPDEAARRAERALRAHLLAEAGGDYMFANDLIREAIYETTPRPTRVARHRRAAELVTGNPEAMAAHFTAVGDWGGAMAALEQAAGRAVKAFATSDAEQLFTEALSVAALVDDPLATARIRLARGRVREGLGGYQDAHDDHATALMLARAAGDQVLEAAALERLGWTAYYARDVPALEALTARAHEYAERAAAAPARGAGALVLVGRLRHAEGDPAAADEALRAVLDGDLDVRTRALAQQCYGLLLEHTDRYQEARAALELGIADSRRGGFARNLITGEFAIALACANEGDFGSALRRVDAMERALRHFDDPLYRARAATTRSWIWRELGDSGLARDHAQEALELTGGSAGSRHPGIHAEMAAAECALLDGDEDEAAGLLETCRSALDASFYFSWRARLRHLELCARLDPAVAEELLSRARSHGSPKYEALALAHLGRREDASSAAQRTGSDYLLALAAPPAEARAACLRIAERLPAELRARFLERGHLVRRLQLE